MNNSPNKYIFGSISLLCTTGIVFLLSKIVPLGMAGSIESAKGYIVIVIILLLIGLPAAVMYQIGQAKTDVDPELQRMRWEMKALSHQAAIQTSAKKYEAANHPADVSSKDT